MKYEIVDSIEATTDKAKKDQNKILFAIDLLVICREYFFTSASLSILSSVFFPNNSI